MASILYTSPLITVASYGVPYLTMIELLFKLAISSFKFDTDCGGLCIYSYQIFSLNQSELINYFFIFCNLIITSTINIYLLFYFYFSIFIIFIIFCYIAICPRRY